MEIVTSFADFVTQNNNPQETPREWFGSGALPFTFHSWQREKGLPQNYVRALAQTRDGYVWAGGDDGVARFDGLRFVPFGLREGLNSGPVKTLLGDNAGALWIGGAAGGLTRCQGGHFAAIANVPSGAILALAEDKKHQIWIGTEAGLAIWQAGKLQTHPFLEPFRNKAVAALTADDHGNMWIGVKTSGVFRYDGVRMEKISDHSVESLLEDPHCLLGDHQDRLWVGAANEFVLYLEKGRWRLQGIRPHQGKPYVAAVAESPDGTIWAGSVG